MKKIKSLIIIFILVFNLSAMKKFSLNLNWESPDTFRVPESVIYDKANQILYIANINGKPTEKNNGGFISKLDPETKKLTLNWITGINAPKGMGILNNFLYVTDIDRVHKVDIAKGKIVKSFGARGAQFLNDIAIDKNGNVFITDMLGNSIYKITKNKITRWIILKNYSRPNGIIIYKKNILTGTGQGIIRINPLTQKITLLVKHKGGIDGLKNYKENSFIVTDWAGKTQLIGKNKAPYLLLDTTDKKINAADFEYIPEKKLIIIPTFFYNRIMFYTLD